MDNPSHRFRRNMATTIRHQYSSPSHFESVFFFSPNQSISPPQPSPNRGFSYNLPQNHQLSQNILSPPPPSPCLSYWYALSRTLRLNQTISPTQPSSNRGSSVNSPQIPQLNQNTSSPQVSSGVISFWEVSMMPSSPRTLLSQSLDDYSREVDDRLIIHELNFKKQIASPGPLDPKLLKEINDKLKFLNMIPLERQRQVLQMNSGLRSLLIARCRLSTGLKKKEHKCYLANIKKMKKDLIWYVLGTEEMDGHCAEIARIYDVHEATLERWHRKMKQNPSWEGPSYKKSQEGYVFSEKQEENLVNIINFVIQKLHQPMTNYLFHILATSYYHSIPDNEKQQINLNFNASNRYIKKFRERHNLSRRRAHPKRRTSVQNQEIAAFREKIQHLATIVCHDHILNSDETFWRLDDFNLFTWAPTGSDNVIVQTNDNEKAGFTSLATISLDGDKFPLVHIAKGKTKRAEKNWFLEGRSIGFSAQQMAQAPKIKTFSHPNLQISANSYTDHSQSGWTTRETWGNFLHKVRNDFVPLLPDTQQNDPNNRIYLLSDSYRVHNSPDANTLAESLNIELVPIPPGTTDACQPLDCRIFGVLKAKARFRMTKRIADHVFTFFDPVTCSFREGFTPLPPMDHQAAMSLLEEVWSELTKETIQSSWDTAHLLDWEV